MILTSGGSSTFGDVGLWVVPELSIFILQHRCIVCLLFDPELEVRRRTAPCDNAARAFAFDGIGDIRPFVHLNKKMRDEEGK